MTVKSPTSRYGVIVVGGGAAGVGAALGARHALPDAPILLLESESCLGGAATHRGVASYCGLYTCESDPRQAVGGVWDELRELLIRNGGTDELPQRHRGVFQVVDPECVKFCLDELLQKHRIEVILHAPVVSACRSDEGHIEAVWVQDREGCRRFEAGAFVDCSGDCDLAFLGGASVRYGNHGQLNLGTMSTRFGGLPMTVNPTAESWSSAIKAAKRQDPNTILTKESSVLLRLPRSGDVMCYLASAPCDARDAASITAAERLCRKQAQEYAKVLRRLPGHENLYVVSTGHNFGTRESRHINAVYQLKKEDIMQSRKFADCVALGAWGFEWHRQEDYGSSFAYVPQSCFEIPLSCLRSKDTPNLFAAGRCADGDQAAGSSIRVMGTALATGQAAGVAAAFVADGRFEKGGYFALAEGVRRTLRERGALLDPNLLENVRVAGA